MCKEKQIKLLCQEVKREMCIYFTYLAFSANISVMLISVLVVVHFTSKPRYY